MYTSHNNSFDELYELVKVRKVPFLIVFFVTVVSMYGFLYAIDFIPEPIAEKESSIQEAEASETDEDAESVKTEEKKEEPVKKATVVSEPLPIKIIFDSLDTEVKVLNPTSRDVAALDTALLSGAVRHPDSADFKNVGNIFILGHSSYLPNVINKNFQAFNGIQKLTWGDTIRLQSGTTEYTYRVQKVYQAKTSDVVVPATPGKAMLTLATCNSFGAKDDRFVVEALLIGEKPI